MRAAVLLFFGDPRRDSKQKRLPPRFLPAMHRSLQQTITRIDRADLFTITSDGSETLGQQIERAIAMAFGSGYGRVLIVAGDVVLSRRILIEALERLETQPLVLGRSGDGGFYLAGFTRPPQWDWDAVVARRDRAADALAIEARAIGCEPALLPVVDDIDSYADAVRLTATATTSILRQLASLLPSRFATPRRGPGGVASEISLDPLRGPPPVATPA